MGSHYSSEFRSTEAGEAEAHLRARYGSLDLSATPRHFGERVRADSEFAFVEHDYGGRFTIAGELDLFSVGVPVDAADYRWEIGGQRGAGVGAPLLFQPGVPFTTHVDRVRMRAVTFEKASLARQAAALFAVDEIDVRFASARPRSGALARLWSGLVEFAVDRGDPEYGLLHASLRSTLTRMLLEGFVLASAPQERRASAVGLWFGYRRAVAFIEEHVSLPITLADITAAAGLSRRQLDHAFRTHSPEQVTALGHLRLARLDAAHGDLDAGRGTVAEIARRWGFPSEATFARRYVAHYGVDPRLARRAA